MDEREREFNQRALRLLRALLDQHTWGEFTYLGPVRAAKSEHHCVRCGTWISRGEKICKAQLAEREWWVHSECPNYEDIFTELCADSHIDVITDTRVSEWIQHCPRCNGTIAPGDHIVLSRRPGGLPARAVKHSDWIHRTCAVLDGKENV